MAAPRAMVGSGFVAGTASLGTHNRLGFSVEWQPSPVILMKDFAKLGLSIKSFREPLKRSIQQVVSPSIGQNFDEEGRPEPWQPLSDRTVAKKVSEGKDNGILIRTGKLRRVAQQFNAWTVTNDAASFNKLPGAEYGGFHQTGIKGEEIGVLTGVGRNIEVRESGGLPQRVFANIQEHDLPALDAVFAEWLSERAALAGFAGGL